MSISMGLSNLVPHPRTSSRRPSRWDGLWRRGTRDKLPEFIGNYAELAPLIRGYIMEQRVFLASLDEKDRTRKRIEGGLADHFKTCGTYANLLANDIRYVRRNKAEPAMIATFTSDAEIQGLPAELQI